MSRNLQILFAFLLIGTSIAQRAVFVHRGPIFRAEPMTTTTDRPKPTPPPINCAIRENGAYLPEGILCSNLYYTCEHSVSRFHWCPENTVFNTDKGVCDFYANVRDCPSVIKLTPKPTIPTPTTPKPTIPPAPIAERSMPFAERRVFERRMPNIKH